MGSCSAAALSRSLAPLDMRRAKRRSAAHCAIGFISSVAQQLLRVPMEAAQSNAAVGV